MRTGSTSTLIQYTHASENLQSAIRGRQRRIIYSRSWNGPRYTVRGGQLITTSRLPTSLLLDVSSMGMRRPEVYYNNFHSMRIEGMADFEINVLPEMGMIHDPLRCKQVVFG